MAFTGTSETIMPPEQAEAAAETPVAEEPVENAAPEPAEGDADAPAADVPEDGGEGAAEAPEGQGGGSEPEPEPAPKKSATARLQGRIGHLTKTLHDKDAELARERSQREALEALLNGRGDGGAPPPAPAPAAATPTPGTDEFDRLVDERATHKARAEAFTRDCNTIFDAGVGKHGKDAFEEAVTNLNALGLMDETLVEAAMATDAPADVIHFLGSDVDEATRIRALPPIRMAAEIVKLSATLAKPKDEKPVSRVPPPINPVGGAQQASIDVSDPNISQAEYVRRRKAQGSRWAR